MEFETEGVNTAYWKKSAEEIACYMETVSLKWQQVSRWELGQQDIQ